MKKIILLVYALVSLQSFGQEGVWKQVSLNGQIKKHKSVEREEFPSVIETFQLKENELNNSLSKAHNKNAQEKVFVKFPNSNGELETFQMHEASNFDQELQARFPDIRAYVGSSLENKGSIIRVSTGPLGVQGMILRPGSVTEFFEPYSSDRSVYAVYKSQRIKGKLPFTCSSNDQNLSNVVNKGINGVNSNNLSFKTMRLALSCTAEYSNYFGATSAAQVNLVIAGFNATLARVNGINEKDLAIRLLLVNQSTNVIFYNPATDPYSIASVGTDSNNANNANGWNIQLQNTLNTTLTGAATTLAANNAAYDIGHLFGASGGGGNAGCIGCVCVDPTGNNQKQKGSGYTSPGNGVPAGDAFDVDYVVHEIGHQLGATHTFTHSTEDNTSNYEPGGGTTIMAYAGITARNIQMNSDDYFHARSIDMIQANMQTKACPVSTAITHSAPNVNAGNDYAIPRSTPFMLTGVASDNGGGTLTYCWEQYDEATGAGNLCGDTNVVGDSDCVPAATKTTGPIFRSSPPTTSPTRYFPTLSSVFAGATSTQGVDIISEVLPSVSRTLNFRLTVRDNVLNGGQTNFDDMVVNVDSSKNPLVVTSQNAANQVFATGSTQTVTWSGSGGTTGHNTIAGGANVDILFTNDNGVTWTTLLANTLNDGSESVTLPVGVSGAYCRFMVKASGNIFFNVNTASFAVGNYVYQNQNECKDYVFNFNGTAIPESSTQFTGYQLAVADAYTLTDVNIKVELTHQDIGSVFLGIRPAHLTTGVTQFFNGSCDGNANMNLLFDDQGAAINCAATTSQAATLPANPFAPFNGNPSNGNWIFFITDINTTDGLTGTVQKVTLNLCKSVMVPVLGSESFGLQDFAIYPNPNKGNFSINFEPKSNDKVEVLVHDLRGRQIYSEQFDAIGTFNQEINLKKPQTGIYIVTVKQGDVKEVNKIVIE